MISATIPQCQLSYGNILQSKVPVLYRKFLIPFISSVMGILIPPESALLIPMKVLYQTLIELTLSPFAFFTTGYQDRN